MDLFFLKKFVGCLVMPLGTVHFLLILGLVFLFRRSLRAGRMLILAATLVLYLFSLSPLADLLARPLEEAYPVVRPDQLPPDLSAVVVLSGGVLDRSDLPPAARLGGDTLQRVLEGVRLWRARPEARLIMCGGEWSAKPDIPTPARLMADLALDMGVDRSKIVLDETSRDTYENAQEAAELMNGKAFALVTSARHLPRAVAIFRKMGREPIPAPTDHKIRALGSDNGFLPSLGGLASTQESLHEYLGLAWYWLNGRL